MLVLALNTGHDGAFAAVKDGRLLFSQEAEKDSFERHAHVNAQAVMNFIQGLGEIPDVVSLVGGWRPRSGLVGTGYLGAELVEQRPINFFGRTVTLVESSHERSHIMSSIALAPRDDAPLRAALVWEGQVGKLYLVDGHGVVKREVPVLEMVGTRWSFLFALADPTFPDRGAFPWHTNAGKLMALAAFGDPDEADPIVTDVVDQVLTRFRPDRWASAKWRLRESPIHNAGVEADITKNAAALLSRRIFETFSTAAVEHLPPDIPFHISGGCGLNCDWNSMWRDLGHFSSVFVPPCPNDSGLAIGGAADALRLCTGDPFIDWDVYGGLEFEWDQEPDPSIWRRQAMTVGEVADALADGRIVAWVQGRAEIGPRALGNRSLLADPSDPRTRDRLNEIKQRENYRPIAPVCRIEDAAKVFDTDFEDPYMLYFRMVTSDRLGAVTHVDGSARCQTVTQKSNRRLHELLCAVADRSGIGVLCNTSLNFKGLGFINRMSHLAEYCEERGVDDFVAGDAWFQRIDSGPGTAAGVERLRSHA
jgi:hydroxymethyl cephem carbamoyltransferase